MPKAETTPSFLAAKCEADQFSPVSGMVPSVIEITGLDGEITHGFRFEPQGARIGDRVHYDHGVGIEQNQDAKIVYLKA